MVTINGIQTLLNIDEQELESQTFKEPSAQWLDYNTQQQQQQKNTNQAQSVRMSSNSEVQCLIVNKKQEVHLDTTSKANVYKKVTLS